MSGISRFLLTQRVLYARVRRCTSSQRGAEAQEATRRSDGVGQPERRLRRRRRLAEGGTASVPSSVHVRQLQGNRLARQSALRAAASRNGSTARRLVGPSSEPIIETNGLVFQQQINLPLI